MKRLSLLVLIFFVSQTGPSIAAEEAFRFGRFGTVRLYYERDHLTHVVLFVSGDGGWNRGVVDMARELAGLKAVVAGVDITQYMNQLKDSREKCSYPAADFELLSKFIQKKLGFSQYEQPVMVGYSSGATLVYAALVQAPPNTFKGAISLGFCPDLSISKPFCRGSGLEWTKGPKGRGYSFLPATHLQVPWIVLQGTVDQVCNAEKTRVYVEKVNMAKLVLLPKVGHGFSVPRNWMPQFKEAFAQLVQKEPAGNYSNVGGQLGDLPLIEVPADDTGSAFLAVFLSGDGGWADIDHEVSAVLAEHGVPVIGLNSLKYFWNGRTPAGAAIDLERILKYYLVRWQKQKAVLIGYSFGADVAPFLFNRLPEELRERVALIVLLSPGLRADFEFHLTDWLGFASKTARAILPEVEKIQATPLLCLYGEEEQDTVCKRIQRNHFKVIALKGRHHFNGNYSAIT
jgi:type IV secretory pathway VirJ component